MIVHRTVFAGVVQETDKKEKEKEEESSKPAEPEHSGLEANEEEYKSLKDRVDKIETTVTAVLTSMDAVLEKMSHAEAIVAAAAEHARRPTDNVYSVAGAPGVGPDGRPRSRSDVRPGAGALGGMDSETGPAPPPKSGVRTYTIT